jgi:hypothetical protein
MCRNNPSLSYNVSPCLRRSGFAQAGLKLPWLPLCPLADLQSAGGWVLILRPLLIETQLPPGGEGVFDLDFVI